MAFSENNNQNTQAPQAEKAPQAAKELKYNFFAEDDMGPFSKEPSVAFCDYGIIGVIAWGDVVVELCELAHRNKFFRNTQNDIIPTPSILEENVIASIRDRIGETVFSMSDADGSWGGTKREERARAQNRAWGDFSEYIGRSTFRAQAGAVRDGENNFVSMKTGGGIIDNLQLLLHDHLSRLIDGKDSSIDTRGVNYKTIVAGLVDITYHLARVRGEAAKIDAASAKKEADESDRRCGFYRIVKLEYAENAYGAHLFKKVRALVHY